MTSFDIFALKRLYFTPKKRIYELWHEIFNNVVCATSKGSDQPVHTRSLDQSHCLSLEYSMNVKLLTEHHLEFLSLKGGCTGSSESIHVKFHTLLEISWCSSYILLGPV